MGAAKTPSVDGAMFAPQREGSADAHERSRDNDRWRSPSLAEPHRHLGFPPKKKRKKKMAPLALSLSYNESTGHMSASRNPVTCAPVKSATASLGQGSVSSRCQLASYQQSHGLSFS